MLDRLQFVFGEALQGMRRHGLMSFAAVSTVAIALYLLGGLGHVYYQISNYASNLTNRYEIRAFVKDGTNYDGIRKTAQEIRKIDGVKAAVWIPKDKAWEAMKKQYPEAATELDNPLPDAFKVTLSDISKFDSVVSKIRAIKSIQENDGVVYHDQSQRTLNDAMRVIRWLGSVLGGLLLLTAGILIYNAIRLTLDVRKREIRIMQLVGASHLTVRVPFLIEGAIQGALGGALATILLWSTYESIRNYVANNMDAFAKPASFSLAGNLLLLAALGALYGVICSVLAIRNPSRLRGGAI